MKSNVYSIAAEVINERHQQNAKWGFPQPAMGDPPRALAVLAEEFGEAARAVTEMDCAARHGETEQYLKWKANLRQELIQTAAVAMAFVQHMDKRDYDDSHSNLDR